MTPGYVHLRPWEEDFRLPDRFNMVDLLLERHLEAGRGDSPAVIEDDRRTTYAQLGRLTNRVGNALAGLGVGHGDRVIMLLYDSAEFIAVFLGAMKLGAVPAPINILATSADLKYFINDSGAKALVVEADMVDRVAAIAAECPGLAHVIVRGGDGAGGRPALEQLLDDAADGLDLFPTAAADHSYWLYTSGTTGQPKGVIHLHKDLVYAVETWGEHTVGFTDRDLVFCVSKLFFSYGLNNGLYLPLYYGASVVLTPERPTPAAVLDIIERHRPTALFSVPTSYGQVLNHIEAEGLEPDLSSLRFCVSAGEALPGPIFQRWLDRFGLEILDGLGSSEISFIYICNRPGQTRKNSSGQLLPGYRAKVLDEDGRPVPVGQVGDLWIKSPSVTPGYWNKPDKTAETFVDGWMKTGDRCHIDEDGYYFYSGRADDALKVGGIWVSPLEVEEALLHHPAVAECAVVGRKDDMDLTKPQAFVVLKGGHDPGEELAGELKGFVKKRLAPYKYPRWIEFVEDLPKTSTGKIQRYKLRLD